VTFFVPADFAFAPAGFSLYTLKMRFTLLAMHQTCARDRGDVDDAAHAVAWRVPAVEIKRLIGPWSSNDNRALRRACAELQSDPSFEVVSFGEGNRDLTFRLAPQFHDQGYMPRYFRFDMEEVAAATTTTDLMTRIFYRMTCRMRTPFTVIDNAALGRVIGRSRAPDIRWIRDSLLPALQDLSRRAQAEVYLAAVWSDGPDTPGRLILRFRTAGSSWRASHFVKTSSFATAWRIDAAAVTPLATARARMIAPRSAAPPAA
jgi:hypothetical protein